MKLERIIFPLWQLLPTLLLLSALTFADDGLPDKQGRATSARIKKRRNTEDTRAFSHIRRKRQLFDGLPNFDIVNAAGRVLDGFDRVLKNAQNFDVFQCVERFGCEMAAPLVNEEASTDGEAAAADTGDEAEVVKDDEAAHETEVETKQAPDPEMVQRVVQQVMQSMFQAPLTMPSPFMPTNPFLFNPFVSGGFSIPAAETTTEGKVSSPEPEPSKEHEDENESLDPAENELPRPPRHVSPTNYMPNIRKKVYPYRRGSSHRSPRPVNRVPQVRIPVLPPRTSHQMTSVAAQSHMQPREFSPHIYTRNIQAASNIVESRVSPNHNHRFIGSPSIKRNDQVNPRYPTTRMHSNNRAIKTANSQQSWIPTNFQQSWIPANATTYFDGHRKRTIRRYVKAQKEEKNWVKRLFGIRRRRSTSSPAVTFEEVKRRVRRDLKKIIGNAATNGNAIMGALREMEEAAAGETTSSVYPVTRAVIRGYMGDHTTCEEHYENCPNSRDDLLNTFINLRKFFPDTTSFRDQIPRPFRYILP